MRRAPLLLLPTSLLAFACSGGDDPDAGALLDGSAMNDGGTTTGGPVFVTDTIEGLNTMSIVGDFAVLRINPQGRPAVAYGFVPNGMTSTFIHLAQQNADNTWTIDEVIRPNRNGRNGEGQFVGLGFDFVNGVPHMTYWGGDFDGVLTSSLPPITDLMLVSQTGATWTERTLVDTSGEAANQVCPGTQGTCTFGTTVGPHSALRARPGGGFGVVYRDFHGGFARDDDALADAEYYSEGGGVGHTAIDTVRSGGLHSDLIFTANGSPLAAYYLKEPALGVMRTGVWTGFHNGTEWVLRQVGEATTSSRVSLAIGPDGTMYVAYFDVDNGDLIVATSSDNALSWSATPVDQLGKTGLHPSIAIDLEGRPVVAYTYCGVAAEMDCPGTLGPNSEVRLARFENGAWKRYLIDDGQGLGGVGFFNQLVVLPDGKLAVVFQNGLNDLMFSKEQ